MFICASHLYNFRERWDLWRTLQLKTITRMANYIEKKNPRTGKIPNSPAIFDLLLRRAGAKYKRTVVRSSCQSTVGRHNISKIAQWYAKTTSSGSSGILLGFTKNALNSAIFGPILKFLSIPIFWDVGNTFLAKN